MKAYDLESLQPTTYVPGQLARAGQTPTDAELREMLPGLRERDYEAIAWRLTQITTPRNRHERRALATRQRLAWRATEKALDLSMDAYEQILALFTDAEKREYERALKHMHPHPDGRFAPTALDPKLTELRRSLFEIAVAFRMHNKRAKRAARVMREAA